MSCFCNRRIPEPEPARRAARINDNNLMNSQNTTCVLATRIFDAVRKNLDASPCLLTVPTMPGTAPFTILSAESNTNYATLSDLTVNPANSGFSVVTAVVNSPGTCRYRDSLSDVYIQPCVLSTGMECLLCFSQDALLPSRPEALCNLQMVAAKNTAAPNVFDLLCDGVCLLMSVGEVPLYMPYTSQLAPADISCRQSFLEPANTVAALFPSPAPCTASPGECGT